jgi:PAS domain S-box-containing protein
MFLVAIAYYFGAQFGFSLRFPNSPLSVIWPPNAILLAALLLMPTQRWWLLLLAVFPAHVLVEYQNGVQLWAIPGLYITNCGQAVLGAAGIRWLSGGSPRLDTLNRMIVYGACAVLGAPFIFSFLDTAVSVFTHWEGSQQLLLHWEERFVSNALTALALPPVILVVATRWREWLRQVPSSRYLEAVAAGIGVVVSGFIVFGTGIAGVTDQRAFIYLPIPFLLWVAVRFGVGGTSIALFGITLLSAGLNAGIAHDPFVAETPAASVLALQIFLIGLSAPVLLLAALMEERDRTAAELRASEERYRAIVSNLPKGYATIYDANLHVLVADGPGLPWPMGGKSPHEVMDEGDHGLVENTMRAAIAGMSASREVCAGHRWYLVQCVPIRQGSDALGLCVTFDITKRKRAEAALRASEARYRDLVEAQGELICRYRPDGTLTFVNDAYSRYFGKSRKELLGMKFFTLLPETEAKRARSALDRFVRDPSAVNDEHTVVQPDGTVVWHQWVERPIFGADGTLLEIQAIGRDITERKHAEHEVARLAAHLLRAQDGERQRIARELHDGTAQTIGSVELILARLHIEFAREDHNKAKIDQLLAESHLLATTAMQELRTLSYLLHPPELDHLGLVGAVQAYAEGFTRRSGVEVTVVAPDYFDRLSPDVEIALFRVVQECLTNVLRHSGSPCAHIRIAASHGYAVLQVRDSGHGIYRRVERHGEGEVETLGVGIPGMRQRLLEFGGRLKIRTFAQGTMITAIIPVRQALAPAVMNLSSANER